MYWKKKRNRILHACSTNSVLPRCHRVHYVQLDQVSKAGPRRSWSICHGEELNPVLIEATRILSCVNNESPQAALARFVPQSQLSLSLCHVKADIENLCHQEVKQSTCDNAAVPRTGKAKCCAVKVKRTNHYCNITHLFFSYWQDKFKKNTPKTVIKIVIDELK